MIFERLWKIIFFVLLTIFSSFSSIAYADANNLNKKTVNLFPILMYDSDIGFGLGGKGVIKNQFQRNESFDLILFGSTKGEQWFVFNFSFPDAELRQGTLYSFSLDLKCEYDKILKSNFFGYGNNSKDNNEQFPKEFLKLELKLGHAFTKQIIGETGIFFNHTSVYNFENNGLMSGSITGAGENITSYLTFRLRWDTRNSQIHPVSGCKISLNSDFTRKLLSSDFKFNRYQLEANIYKKLFTSDHIIAVRFLAQHIDGSAPYYEQSIIGGTWSARGYKVDRFIEKNMTLTSLEYRYQFYEWIGAVFFIDSGRVYRSLRKLSLQEWHSSLGTGLRFYPGTFVVRFDIGVSKEGTRFFFNFGHVF
ncbi:MAG: BamA/TamA family outer membrane protein [Candidatus Cloacimonetes bacterium]|nr:BamA/TamA family outer membrane protein [Candidatus Cloacimonadota bacterium]